jgi:chromosome partitioning protein
VSKTIAIANPKGGVGKSVIAVNLAEYAHELGGRVLLVDLDALGSATRFFQEHRAVDGQGASLLFFDGASPPLAKIRERLWLLPADKALSDVDAQAVSDKVMVRRPRDHLARWAQDFDMVVIDTGPSRSRRQIAALVAADVVVTPVELAKGSIGGLFDVMEDIAGVRQGLHAGLNHGGILVNRYRRDDADQRRHLADLRAGFGERILPCELHERSAVGMAFDGGRSAWHRPKGDSAVHAAREFRTALDTTLQRAHA